MRDEETQRPGRGPVLELEAVDVPAPVEPRAVVVRGVNWRVMEGDRWLITGPAKGGKSSLVGVAAALIRPVRGIHRLFGSDLAEMRESERTTLRLRVGVVFGGGGRLFPSMNVLENLSFPLRYHQRSIEREASDRIGGLLSAFGLEGYARRYPGDLPRWAAQRAGLARALVLQPEVVFLDEPTLGLPMDEEAWWREFLVGDSVAGLGKTGRPRTWVLAAAESRPWEGWAGHRAIVDGGKWKVPGTEGAGLRLTAAS